MKIAHLFCINFSLVFTSYKIQPLMCTFSQTFLTSFLIERLLHNLKQFLVYKSIEERKQRLCLYSCLDLFHKEESISSAYENDLNLKATELRLGLPGTEEKEDRTLPIVRNNKRPLPETSDEESVSKSSTTQHVDTDATPPAK